MRIFAQTTLMTFAQHKSTRFDLICACAMSTFIVIISSAWQGKIGFNLWDEGFLWYGAQRVMQGEVPLRDFMAYDPGRYYWSAAVMSVTGSNGIMALRLSLDIFQALGLFVGLILIARAGRLHGKHSLPFLLLCGLIMASWMLPRHKIFDLSISLFLTAALSLLIEKPTIRRYFLAGSCVGFAAFFGRNHGIYGAAGSLGIIAWLQVKSDVRPALSKACASWIAGVVLGFSPILFMVALVPGFGSAFFDSIRLLFEMKTTNISLPVPWPWTVDFSSNSFIEIGRQLLIGTFFLLLPLSGGAAIFWLIRKKRDWPLPASFIAASVLTIPYAHYAYSRADVGHLAQGIFPFLIGGLTLLSIQSKRLKWTLTLVLAAASFWVTSAYQPAGQCAKKDLCTFIDISGASIKVGKSTASDIDLLRALAVKYAPNDQKILVAPFWPGAYSLLERSSPMWTIYALWPRSVDFQNNEIERIKKNSPTLAFIYDFALDGRDDLRFRNTYPLLYKYIQGNFERVAYPFNPAYEIYKAKEPEK
ncbi:hypothetical protein ACFZAC_03975 [Pseudomonas fluorescens]|uniref:hypothetical protein n=1 Tax=Pseudomonas fluorescens TaxID=294 RepID=UPI003748097B